MTWILLAAAILVGAGGLIVRRRVLALRRDAALSDDAIREIEERGRLELEEPLDREHIHEEEQRFWEESWDEPDEW